MNSKQLYYVMLATIALMILGLLGGVYGVQKVLSGEATELVSARLQVAVLDNEQRELTQAKQDIKKYRELADIARSVVPQDKDQAQTIQQIVAIAKANGINLSSITFPSSTLGTAKGSDGNLSQLTPVKDIKGVYNLQLTVQSDPTHPVPYNQFLNFLDGLEHNRRTALVQSVTIQPNELNRNTLSFTLILDEYIKP